MQEIIWEKKDYLRVLFNPDLKYCMFEWKRFGVPLKYVQAAFLAADEKIIQGSVKFLIAGTGETQGTLFDDVIEWWEKIHIPHLLQIGVEAIITIVPKSALGLISTKQWQKTLYGNMITANVQNLQEAEDFIRKIL